MGYTGASGGWRDVYEELDADTGIEAKNRKEGQEKPGDTEKETMDEIFYFVEENKRESEEAFEEELLETQNEVERQFHKKFSTIIFYLDFNEQEVIPAVIDHWKDENVYASLEWSKRIEENGEMDNLRTYLEYLSDAIDEPEGLMENMKFGIPEGLENFAQNIIAGKNYQEIAEHAANADETSIPYIFPATSQEDYFQEI